MKRVQPDGPLLLLNCCEQCLPIGIANGCTNAWEPESSAVIKTPLDAHELAVQVFIR